MLRIFNFAAVVLLAACCAVQPAGAVESNPLLDWVNQIYGEDAGAGTRETGVLQLQDWPVALHLPPGGTLLVQGAEGAAEAGLGEDDFQWFVSEQEAIASAGSGEPIMLNGIHQPLGLTEELTNKDWTAFDADFRSEPDPNAIEVAVDLERWIDGRRWMVYHNRYVDADDPTKSFDICFAVTLTSERAYMLSLSYHAAPEGALDAGLLELLGADAAEE